MRAARGAIDGAVRWLETTARRDLLDLEAGARRFALTIGRSLEIALLARHAQWARDQGDMLPGHAVARLRSHGHDLLRDLDRGAMSALGTT